MKKRVCAIFVSIILLLTSVTTARADEGPPPQPFSVVSEDGTKVFYVTPHIEVLLEWMEWVERGYYDWIDTDGWSVDLPETGLYYNTYPRELIYSVWNPERNPQRGDFIFSNDLRHFVWIPERNLWLLGASGWDGSDSIALIFYADGLVQRTYRIADLVRNLDRVELSIGSAFWVNRRTIDFNSETNLLTLTTVDNLTYVFDITTGAITEGPITISTAEDAIDTFDEDPRNDLLVWIPVALGVAGLIGGVTILVIKRRHTE